MAASPPASIPVAAASSASVVGSVEPVRRRLAGQRRRGSRRRRVAVVEDDPGGQVGVLEAGRRRTGGTAPPKAVVVGRLVANAAPVAVDDDAARPAALEPHAAAALVTAEGVAGDLQRPAPTRPRPCCPEPAPARIAIRSPSPVLQGGETGPCIGPLRKALTSSGSHSKPPVARTTPRRASTSTVPSGVSQLDPADRARLVQQARPPRQPVRGLDPEVEQGPQHAADQRLAHDPDVAAPSPKAASPHSAPASRRRSRRCVQSLGKAVTRAAHSPSSAKSNGERVEGAAALGAPAGDSGL